MAKAKAEESGNSVVVKIPTANIQQMWLVLQGVGEGLLVQRFSESKMGDMEKKSLGEAKTSRPHRVYEQEFQEARYIRNGKDVFPSAAIKRAVVEGCSFVDGVYKTTARGAFFILGEYVEIESPKPPEIHKAIVYIGRGSKKIAQVRIRPLYRNWQMRVPIRYDANILSADQLVFLFVQAGFSVGLGDWRPQCNGSFGMFEVKTNVNGKVKHGYDPIQEGQSTLNQRTA
jgi:hypothetical protein